MNFKNLFLPAIISTMVLLSACGNRELKKDAAKIGDAMCRNIEVMSKMKAANIDDSATLKKLRLQSTQLQNEMMVMYQDFNKKYGDKTKDQKFIKEFNSELRKSMLECPYLSKTDREIFERELKE
ncbi:MAG: hypothetical protein NTW10_01050 [Bacteroidetes bacterium]|nr:hypothetical protein [Bacteroidota bacterium]